MWTTYSKKGTKIESPCWDWACMNKIIADYMEEFGMTEDQAYYRFWLDLKRSDPEDFEECLHGKRLDYAIGEGWFDDSRACYLLTLDIKCHHTPDK